jgi:hypothetical protein
VAGVDGCTGIGGKSEIGDRGEGAAEDEDGVRGAGIGPGMAAWASDGDSEAAAAKSAGDYCVEAAPFECDGSGDSVAVKAVSEDVTHTAEVSLALFAYIGGEDYRDGRDDMGITKGGGDGEEAGEAGTVIADPRGVDAGRVGVFDRFTGCAGGEDRVEMGGDKDAGG